MNLRVFLGGCSVFLLLGCPSALAQRAQALHSVLASGNWYRIGIRQEAVYKVDITLLTSLGITTENISSAAIRLYGNGGAMVDENNATTRPDDLVENPIDMHDGGDGIFNGNDYFLFYAPGPHRWLKDSTGQGFRHQKNLYTDTAYYFITIGGNGKRISNPPPPNNPTVAVNSYQDRYFYENDLVNLLNSGKEWYGEAFTTNLGGSSSRTFTVDWPGLLQTQPVTLVTDLAARSVGAASNFSVKLNGQNAQSVNLPGVSGNFLDPTATASLQKSQVSVSSNNLAVTFDYTPLTAGSQGWLNWFELHGRRALATTAANQLFFRDWASVQPGAVASFTIAHTGSNLMVWEVTDPLQPQAITVSSTATQTIFNSDVSRLREYVAFTATNLLQPIALGKQPNQDLHGTGTIDYIIITHSSLLVEAQRLAAFHQQKNGYRTVIATTEQVYQEFSGGQPDPTALRDFVKMFYDRAGTDLTKRPRYLLLFGSASYDYRNRVPGNSNLVPGYESVNSLDPLFTHTSDDFFGMLKDGDDINRNDPKTTLALGIGRIPARTVAEARIMVDKIIRYHAATSMGPWRNQTVFVADDKDLNLHLEDAEAIAATAAASNPLQNQSKIYLDAFPVVSSSSGARYPAVNDAIVSQVFNGALIVNYSGHGSYQRLADEAVLTQEELNRFTNPYKLPLFITASCDFAPHDDPSKNSLGMGVLTGSENGAIALLTTTRLVFAYSNRQMNENYLRIAMKPLSNGQYLTLGESVQEAKNYTSLTTGDLLNNRKFTLLGDPAMRLAFPEGRVRLTTMNGAPISGADTLRALQQYTFTGEVTDGQGNLLSGFNGRVLPTVYDKEQTVKTRGNDPASKITSYNQQTNILYKGMATVTNGRFSFSFIVPKDITYQPGKARISLYAADGLRDANGVQAELSIGGAAATVITDNTGPQILPYLNDSTFINGGLTHENPVLLVKLYDSSGISTSGTGIGHDITAVIDGVERNILVLNDFYTAELDSYQRGQVLFQLPTLTEGRHSIRIKAWDVANHSNEAVLDFVVVKKEKLQVTELRNFPNPFQGSTTFSFEHNQPNTDLDVTIRIFNMAGGLVKEIHRIVNTGGTRNCTINWAGDNQSGAKLTKGIYIYSVKVVAAGSQTETARQLILF
ncbi:MAG TPA: type IX secretion system sortase PorU [Sediminibacterium sp.]